MEDLDYALLDAFLLCTNAENTLKTGQTIQTGHKEVP